jgi:hypothetical protein
MPLACSSSTQELQVSGSTATAQQQPQQQQLSQQQWQRLLQLWVRVRTGWETRAALVQLLVAGSGLRVSLTTHSSS